MSMKRLKTAKFLMIYNDSLFYLIFLITFAPFF